MVPVTHGFLETLAMALGVAAVTTVAKPHHEHVRDGDLLDHRRCPVV